MTIRLNFEKSNQKRLLQLLDWLKGVGVVSSYELENTTVVKEEEEKDVILEKMVEQAEQDFAKGHVYSSEEVSSKIENWLKEQK